MNINNHSLFLDNRAGASGISGGAYVRVENNGSITFHNNAFVGNTAGQEYGGLYLYLYHRGEAIGSNLRLEGNQSGDKYGGGYIYAEYASTERSAGVDGRCSIDET